MTNLVVIVFVLFCSSGLALGQIEQDKDAPIRLDIVNEETSICFDERLSLNVTVSNRSDIEILIDKRAIGDSLSFSSEVVKLSKLRASSLNSLGDSGPDYEPDYHLLVPGGSYTKTIFVSLDDEFFAEDGKYEARVGYRQFLRSNYSKRQLLWVGSVYSDAFSFTLKRC